MAARFTAFPRAAMEAVQKAVAGFSHTHTHKPTHTHTLREPRLSNASSAYTLTLTIAPSPDAGSWSSLQQKYSRKVSTSEGEPDTHNDFKPVHKAPSDILSVKEQIEKDVKENPVMLYMKGIPTSPRCGFSAMATRILQAHGVPFAAKDILEDEELRQTMKTYSNWPTFPQLYINGEFVGGCDILKKMHESGELEEMLKSVPRK